MEYATALTNYLKSESQEELAKRVGCSQATISRYKDGDRFPSRDLAEKIDNATEGKVPVALWIASATKRFGLAA
jgi:transcriptional regulator with XRE-family HTH domain